MKKATLFIKQLSKQLAPWQNSTFSQPKHGWIRNIRKALGMTSMQLSKKLDVNRSRIIRIEQDEQTGALTLNTLKKVASALNCHLVYSLVPNEPLSELLEKQAERIARRRVSKINHSMILENQQVEPLAHKEQVDDLKKQLLEGNLKHLWEEE